jgi:RNA-binding protein NOB1
MQKIAGMASDSSKTTIHTVILDAGPIIKGEPSASALLQQCQRILSIPSVISEIRDQETRRRLETTILPFLELRSPKPESISFVSAFARKTGDLAVLSRTDIHLLALAYDVECELNHGDWRLRRTPGQKRTNGPPPSIKDAKSLEASTENDKDRDSTAKTENSNLADEQAARVILDLNDMPSAGEEAHLTSAERYPQDNATPNSPSIIEDHEPCIIDQLASHLESTGITNEEALQLEDFGGDSDSEGWITPSNIKRKQIEDANAESSDASETKVIQVVRVNGHVLSQVF